MIRRASSPDGVSAPSKAARRETALGSIRLPLHNAASPAAVGDLRALADSLDVLTASDFLPPTAGSESSDDEPMPPARMASMPAAIVHELADAVASGAFRVQARREGRGDAGDPPVAVIDIFADPERVFSRWDAQKYPTVPADLRLTMELLVRQSVAPKHSRRLYAKLRNVDEYLAAKVAAGEPQPPSRRSFRKDEYAASWYSNFLDMPSDVPALRAEQPAGFVALSITPYQRETLAFMLETEDLLDDPDCRGRLWIRLPGDYWFSPALMRFSFDVPPVPVGGFVLDDMGMGKTVVTLSTILARPAPAAAPPLPPPGAASTSSGTGGLGGLNSRATLVVLPAPLVSQWKDEIEAKTSLSVLDFCYQNKKRFTSAEQLASSDYDVVLIPYLTLKRMERDFRFLDIVWHRVIFDEAHSCRPNIIDPNAVTNEHCTGVRAWRRWQLTGTPITKSSIDLTTLFEMCRIAPLHDRNTEFFGNIRATPALPYLLCSVSARRLQPVEQAEGGGEELPAGEAGSPLPPLSEEMVYVTLAAPERDLYLAVHERMRMLRQRLKALPKNEANGDQHRSIWLKLRTYVSSLHRICSGGVVNPSNMSVAEAPDSDTSTEPGLPVGDLQMPEGTECSICFVRPCPPCATACGHWFCHGCILSWVDVFKAHNHDRRPTCPMCRTLVHEHELRAPPPPTSGGSTASTSANELNNAAWRIPPVACTSKMDALAAELLKMPPTSKALVFTSYCPHEFIKHRLQVKAPSLAAGVVTLSSVFVRRDGIRAVSESRSDRSRAITRFNTDPTVRLALATPGDCLGLNLQAADHVFFLEPLDNRQQERQAIARAWRMGQTRPVVVKKLCVRGAAEDLLRTREGSAAIMTEAARSNILAALANNVPVLDGPSPVQ